MAPKTPRHTQKRVTRKPGSIVVDAAYVRQLIAAVDATVARQPKPYDWRDSPRDRLFALIMQRLDCLQANRPEYLRVFTAIQHQPALLRAVGPALYASITQVLKRADLPAKPWHVAAVGVVYTAVVAIWRNDTTADLAKTMRTCDRALAVLENVVTIIPSAAA